MVDKGGPGLTTKTETFAWWAIRRPDGSLRVAHGQGLYWSEKQAWAETRDLDGERPIRVRVTVQPIEGGD